MVYFYIFLLFSSIIVPFDTSLLSLSSTIGTFFFVLFVRSSLDIFSADSWTARESCKPMSECYRKSKKLNQTLMTPVLTARIIWSSASSEAPEVVCCVTAGIHGGGS